jgi:hypothetical protein
MRSSPNWRSFSASSMRSWLPSTSSMRNARASLGRKPHRARIRSTRRSRGEAAARRACTSSTLRTSRKAFVDVWQWEFPRGVLGNQIFVSLLHVLSHLFAPGPRLPKLGKILDGFSLVDELARVPMWRTLISMTGASGGPEAAGRLAGEDAGEGCVAAFFAMPAI